MGFLSSLFGGENNYLTMVIALAIVLALIVLAVWLLKVLSQTTRSLGRGRQRRLFVVDSIAIDQKRQAVIVRRDNTEHLLVIGGPNDVLVETGFEAPPLPTSQVRASRRMMQPQQTAAPEATSPPATRAEPAVDKPKSKSLRHTGLLRTEGPDAEDQLPGGKRRQNDPDQLDSDTYGTFGREEPAFETVTEAGDSDSGGTNKGKRS